MLFVPVYVLFENLASSDIVGFSRRVSHRFIYSILTPWSSCSIEKALHDFYPASTDAGFEHPFSAQASRRCIIYRQCSLVIDNTLYAHLPPALWQYLQDDLLPSHFLWKIISMLPVPFISSGFYPPMLFRMISTSEFDSNFQRHS